MKKFNQWFGSNIFAEYLPMILIVIVVGVGILYLNTKTKQEKKWSEFSLPTSMLESNFVEYQAFEKSIWDIYPYYEPDGVTYKANLYNLLKAKEDEAKSLYVNLSTMTSATDPVPGIREGVKDELNKLNSAWFKYRDSACYLREDIWSGGSGSSGFLMMCQLYETQKYIDLLNKYAEDFLE